MRAKFFCVVGILMSLLTPAAVAQQGHPLVGVWSGDWGPTPAERHPVVVEMLWENTTLERQHQSWRARRRCNQSGETGFDELDRSPRGRGQGRKRQATSASSSTGQLENLGSAKRTLTGTWIRGTTKGNFKVTRE